MPWQSVQVGVLQLPRASALPCTPRPYATAIAAWHLPQVRGTLNLKMPDCGLLPGSTACESWQSVQTAARIEPRSVAAPCTLSRYDMAGCVVSPAFPITHFCAWQRAQGVGTLV